MSDQSPVPKDHPLMIAWEAYKLTEEYKNSLKWASTARVEDHGDGSMTLTYPHKEGSLWGAFMEGFNRRAVPASDVQEGRSVTMPVLTCPECGATDMNPHDNGCLSMKRFPVGTTKEQAAAWEAKHHPAPVAAVQSPPSRQGFRLVGWRELPEGCAIYATREEADLFYGSSIEPVYVPAAALDTEQAQPQKDSSERGALPPSSPDVEGEAS